MGIAFVRDLRQEGSGSSAAPRQASWPSTLYAGRGAGLGKASVVVGSTRAQSRPSSAKIAWAKPNHVVWPDDVPW